MLAKGEGSALDDLLLAIFSTASMASNCFAPRSSFSVFSALTSSSFDASPAPGSPSSSPSGTTKEK